MRKVTKALLVPAAAAVLALAPAQPASADGPCRGPNDSDLQPVTGVGIPVLGNEDEAVLCI